MFETPALIQIKAHGPPRGILAGMAICSFAVLLEPGAPGAEARFALGSDPRVTLGPAAGDRLALVLEVPDEEGEAAGEWLRTLPGVRGAVLASAFYTDSTPAATR